jgi:hypothetical protein
MVSVVSTAAAAPRRIVERSIDVSATRLAAHGAKARGREGVAEGTFDSGGRGSFYCLI